MSYIHDAYSHGITDHYLGTGGETMVIDLMLQKKCDYGWLAVMVLPPVWFNTYHRDYSSSRTFLLGRRNRVGSQSGMDSLQLCFPCMYVLDIIVVLAGRACTGVVSVMTVRVSYSLYRYMYMHIIAINASKT